MELSWEAPRVLRTAQAQQGTARAQAACKALCLEEQARCLLTAQGLQGWGLICKYSRVGVGFFLLFFNLLVPSGVISILTCTANVRHFTYKLPAGMTPSILHSIHKTYYLFQFKRDHCWIIQLLMRIYIYIYSKQNTCPIYFFLSHLHKCERKQKNQCVYTHECLQIMFWDLSSLQTILQISQHLYNISRRSSIIGKN